MTGAQKITRPRGARSARLWVLASVSVLAAGLALASTAWACSVINGTTEAYEQANSNGSEVSNLTRGTQYHFRGNGAAPLDGWPVANLWLLQEDPTQDNCWTPGPPDTSTVKLVESSIGQYGDIPPDNRSLDRQAREGNQPTVPGTIPSTYPTGAAKLCFTNEQGFPGWHSIPKAVTVV